MATKMALWMYIFYRNLVTPCYSYPVLINQCLFYISALWMLFTINFIYLISQLKICVLFNSDGWLALHYASNNGHTDVVEILLNDTTNIDIVTKVIEMIRMSVQSN